MLMLFCNFRSDFEEAQIPATTITKSCYDPSDQTSKQSLSMTQHLQPILPNITIPQPPSIRPNGNMSSIPLPLLILNHGNLQNVDKTTTGSNGKTPNEITPESIAIPPGKQFYSVFHIQNRP